MVPHRQRLLRLPRLSRKQLDNVIDTSPLPADTHHHVSNARHVYLHYWPGGGSRQFVWSPGVPQWVLVTVADVLQRGHPTRGDQINDQLLTL